MPATATVSHPSLLLAQAQFAGGRRYLAACTTGLPTRATRDALIADLDASTSGHPDPLAYSAAVEHSRALFAALVGVTADRVSICSQASVAAGLVAASLPPGSEVLAPEGDFSSMILPFVHAQNGLRVRTVPLAALAAEVTARTAAVVFSLVQSSTGDRADVEAILAAAGAHGARTVCDATQAAGWMPVAASRFDALICHCYKWLCTPRGVAFLVVSPGLQREIPPLFAGWYAGADPWTSCYGADVQLAEDASRFDASPPWQAFVGAEPALEMFAAIDSTALEDHVTRLATAFRSRLDLDAPAEPSPIVTWADPDGTALARLTREGIVASGRAGRARVAFHLFNDEEDVELAAAALGR
jgi:selenocysteine lyase/cysteine desulfurase